MNWKHRLFTFDFVETPIIDPNISKFNKLINTFNKFTIKIKRTIFETLIIYEEAIQIIEIEDETHFIENPYMEIIEDSI